MKSLDPHAPLEQRITSTRRARSKRTARGLLAVSALPWTPPRPEWGKLLPELAAALFDATNAFRMAHGGDAPYAHDARLEQSIQWKVLHECAGGDTAKQYMAHDDPLKNIGDEQVCPRGWYDRINATGYDGGHPGFQGAAAENLLYGNSSEVSEEGFPLADPKAAADLMIHMWTSAGPGEGHFDNIVARWGAPPAMGVAVAVAPNGLLFAGQDFGTTVAGQPVPPPTPDPTPEPEPEPEPSSLLGRWRKTQGGAVITVTDAPANAKPTDRVTYQNKRGVVGHMLVKRLRSQYTRLP